MKAGLAGAIAVTLAVGLSGCAGASSAPPTTASMKPVDIIAGMDLTTVLPTTDEAKHLLGDAWTVGKQNQKKYDKPSATPTPTGIGPAPTAGTCQTLTDAINNTTVQGLQQSAGVNADGPQNAGGAPGAHAGWVLFAYWDEAVAKNMLDLYQQTDQACSAGGTGTTPSYPSQIPGALGRHLPMSGGTDNCTVVVKANLLVSACSDNPNAEREADSMAKIVVDKLAAAGVR